MSFGEQGKSGSDQSARELVDSYFGIDTSYMIVDFRLLNDELRSYSAGDRREILTTFEGDIAQKSSPTAVAELLDYGESSYLMRNEDGVIDARYILPGDISPDQASLLEHTVLSVVLRQALVYCAAYGASKGASNEAIRTKMIDPRTPSAFINHPAMAHLSFVHGIRNAFPKEENGFIDPTVSDPILGQSVLRIQKAVNETIVIPIESSVEQLLPICLANAADTLSC